jgi:hypothetical protein
LRNRECAATRNKRENARYKKRKRISPLRLDSERALSRLFQQFKNSALALMLPFCVSALAAC